MAKKVVEVQIGGRGYRLRSDADERWLQSVAEYVDESMGRIRSLTETVDSMDVAVLTALNLARELIELRENGPGPATRIAVDPDRLSALIEMAESALAHDEATAN